VHSISRRGFVISAAAAGAAFGLDGPLEFLPPVEAATAVGPNGSPQALLDKGFSKFKVGDIEVTQLYDGTWEKSHDPNFIKGASVDETKAALKAANQTDAYVPIPFTVTVVKLKGKTIMFDAGTGGQAAPTAGLIQKNDLFKKAGIDPAKISTIIVTHFHSDHIFGLMAKDTNAQVFPNAEILVPAVEYKYWTGPLSGFPESRQGLAKRVQATFPNWKNVRQIEAGKDAVPGVRAVASYGHTPGHTSFLLGSGRKQLMVLADVTNIPALFARHPEWQAVFDSDGNMAVDTRRKMFDRVIADKAVITGYHYGMPGAGSMKKDGKGYVFVPMRTA
jgi:glyoxylase-like metal-dependent hydrolase (beta-lactamase superfamily II)